MNDDSLPEVPPDDADEDESDGDAPSEGMERLLVRWQDEDDVEALEELLGIEIKRLSARIRREGQGMLGASITASDLAQEAVCRMLDLSKKPHFATSRSLRHYLWTAAWRLLVSRLRRSNRKVVLPPDAPEIEGRPAASDGFGRLEQDDQRTSLLFAVNLLSDEQREVLELVYFQGLSIDDAAQRLGISRHAANMRLVRGRQNLARKLKQWKGLIG